MTGFIRELANLIGCMSLSERTEVRVFDDDDLRIVFPECTTEPVFGGMKMTVGDLEDALTDYNRGDYDYGYSSRNSAVDEMESDDVGSVVLYGSSKRMFEENIGLT